MKREQVNEYLTRFDSLPIGTLFKAKSDYGDDYIKVGVNLIKCTQDGFVPFIANTNTKISLLKGLSWNVVLPKVTRPIRWV